MLVKVGAEQGRGGEVAQKKNGVHLGKAAGWVDSKRFSCLLSGGKQSN